MALNSFIWTCPVFFGSENVPVSSPGQTHVDFESAILIQKRVLASRHIGSIPVGASKSRVANLHAFALVSSPIELTSQ